MTHCLIFHWNVEYFGILTEKNRSEIVEINLQNELIEMKLIKYIRISCAKFAEEVFFLRFHIVCFSILIMINAIEIAGQNRKRHSNKSFVGFGVAITYWESYNLTAVKLCWHFISLRVFLHDIFYNIIITNNHRIFFSFRKLSNSTWLVKFLINWNKWRRLLIFCLELRFTRYKCK